MPTNTAHKTSYCVAHINLQALQHNFTTLCARIPCHAQGMAIIKNDAYGHGLLPTAKALHEVGAQSFGVGTVYEGEILRQAGYTQEILILLGAHSPQEMALCLQYDLTVMLPHMHSLQLAADTQHKTKKLRVAIKCETGMSRLGFTPEEMPQVVQLLQKTPHIEVSMAVTHISCADMPEKESFVRQQAALFAQMTQELGKAYPQMRRSMCNSAASLAYNELSQEICADIYRFGIALYGGNPFFQTSWQNKGDGLREAMRISTTILHVYQAKAGQAIGYGATYVAEKNMRIAVLGVGYADGFTRGLSGNPQAQICIHKQAAPICGRICMGTLMVDVSHIEPVQAGQQAWIVDAQHKDFSLQALAQRWGTIPYECLCLLGKNTRIYE